eukprot:3937136-Amphidinium_carterae.1
MRPADFEPYCEDRGGLSLQKLVVLADAIDARSTDGNGLWPRCCHRLGQESFGPPHQMPHIIAGRKVLATPHFFVGSTP